GALRLRLGAPDQQPQHERNLPDDGRLGVGIDLVLILRQQYAGKTQDDPGEAGEASQTPRKRGKNRDLYTRSARGKSQSPQNISATTNPRPCRFRKSIARASRWGLSNMDRNSAPRTRTRAANEFSSFRNAIGIETIIKITISEACLR